MQHPHRGLLFQLAVSAANKIYLGPVHGAMHLHWAKTRNRGLPLDLGHALGYFISCLHYQCISIKIFLPMRKIALEMPAEAAVGIRRDDAHSR